MSFRKAGTPRACWPEGASASVRSPGRGCSFACVRLRGRLDSGWSCSCPRALNPRGARACRGHAACFASHPASATCLSEKASTPHSSQPLILVLRSPAAEHQNRLLGTRARSFSTKLPHRPSWSLVVWLVAPEMHKHRPSRKLCVESTVSQTCLHPRSGLATSDSAGWLHVAMELSKRG